MDEARGHSSAAFGLNVASTVIGCIGWVIMIPVLILTFTVWGVAAAESNSIY